MAASRWQWRQWCHVVVCDFEWRSLTNFCGNQTHLVLALLSFWLFFFLCFIYYIIVVLIVWLLLDLFGLEKFWLNVHGMRKVRLRFGWWFIIESYWWIVVWICEGWVYNTWLWKLVWVGLCLNEIDDDDVNGLYWEGGGDWFD